MLDYQPETRVSDNPRFGYANGGEDDGYEDVDHGACYAYGDEDDDPAARYENGRLDPEVVDCYGYEDVGDYVHGVGNVDDNFDHEYMNDANEDLGDCYD